MQPMGHKIAPVISSGMELIIKVIFSIYIVPRLGYWGVVITEPIIWLICFYTYRRFIWYLKEGGRLQHDGA
ncbi:MAG: hypothetical protein LUG52_02335 [Clostridia bacterium]|nr:hypothetical protein [Clostridia bacterium]